MQNATAAVAAIAARGVLCACGVLGGCVLAPQRAIAQSRAAILEAEDRRAPTAGDLAILRAGSRSDNAQTRLVAIRALGRLERPSLVADLVPALKHPLPEIRTEAANAIAQAMQGLTTERSAADARALTSALSTLSARLNVEADPDVRAALCESIGRLRMRTRPTWPPLNARWSARRRRRRPSSIGSASRRGSSR